MPNVEEAQRLCRASYDALHPDAGHLRDTRPRPCARARHAAATPLGTPGILDARHDIGVVQRGPVEKVQPGDVHAERRATGVALTTRWSRKRRTSASPSAVGAW